ncbi:MAG: response regulator [Desulfurivibrio sp.]|nr:MAG: response regulator [Desulfurivibrio sp.]
MMSLFSISGLSVAISCFFVCGIAFIFGKTTLHRLLFYFNIAVSLWGVGIFLAGIAENEADLIRAWKLAHLGGFYVSPVFFHLICTWCDVRHRKIQIFAYGQALVFCCLIIFTDSIINKLILFKGIYFVDVNVVFAMAIFIYVCFIILSYRELIRFLKYATGSKRTQTLVIMSGFFLGFLGGNTTTLPSFHINIFHPACNFGITIYVLILSYSIFRHQLMDFTIIIKKTVAYSLVLLLLITPCFVVVILTEKYLPHGLYYPMLAGIFMLVGFVFPRIKVQAERNLENILFKGVFDYREALDKLSKKMATLHNLEELLAISTQTIARAIDTDSFGAYLLGSRGEFVLASSYGKKKWQQAAITRESELVSYLRSHDEIIQRNGKKKNGDHDREYPGEALEALGAHLCIPIKFENELRGFMVAAEKASAGEYTREEQKVLSTMTHQLAVAIENSLKYDEINKLNSDLEEQVKEIEGLNVNLEKKVEERTEELRKANEELKELDRLKSEFFSNVSHELRTPLTNIILPIQNVLENSGDKIQTDNRTEKEAILRNAHRLMKQINEILDFSRLEAGKMNIRAAEKDLNALLDDIIAAFKTSAEQMDISLSFTPDPHLASIWVDQEKMEKIFYNLIGNALKFTPRGGKVTVVTRKGMILSNGEPVPAVQCSVKDTGVGISARDLPHIYERFRQADSSTSRKYEGTGLGLYLVKEFVDLHHGEVEVSSRQGEGTEFVIRLRQGRDHFSQEEIALNGQQKEASPAAGAQPDRRRGDRRKHERRSGSDRRSGYDRREMSSEDHDTINFMAVQLSDLDQGRPAPEDTGKDPARKTILVVEDNRDLAHNIGRCLKPRYNIRLSGNGIEALAKLREELPDLILSDVMMPEMDGYELCRRVKEDALTSHIPVILLTARTATDDRIEGYQHGADHYLAKPFNLLELQVVIASLLSQRELQAKLSTALKTLQETQVQLVHTARLESVGLLAAGLAHEMKNKMYCLRAGLSGISKRLTMLQEGKLTLAETHDSLVAALNTNEKALESALYVVNALLDFSRKNKEGMGFVDLNKGIEDTLTIVMPMVRDKVSIEKDLHEIPQVECRLEEINQVLMNLVINAYQAMTGPGLVRISTSLADSEVVIVVSDNGPGIAEEHLGKIFTPFFSTKPEGKNSGLGLSICYNIIRGHHGAMKVESRPGKGTEFTINLPVRQKAPADPLSNAA